MIGAEPRLRSAWSDFAKASTPWNDAEACMTSREPKTPDEASAT